MKYKEWLNDWINHYVRITAKARTVVRYTEIINKHICPSLGDQEMNLLSSIELQKFVTELLAKGNKRTGEGLSSSAVNSIITVIKNSLSVAYGLRLINSNPAESIKRPKSVEKKIECFSISEQKQIEQEILIDKRKYLYGVVLCLYTGLRIGELLALEWQDIDFTNGALSVNKTCYEGKKREGGFGRVVDSPKTESSRRVIPLPKQIMPMLKKAKKNSDSEFVIAKSNKPLSVRTYQRNFATLLEKLHIAHRGFHALRHTFATRAIECGMDVKTLSEILGHKDPTITLNRYAHSLMDHKKDMMNRVGKLF